MEWSNDLCLRLLRLYENYPVLWNPKDKSYFSKRKKNEAWENITIQMGLTAADGEEIKKKILSLLGSFRREKSKSKRSMGTATGLYTLIINHNFNRNLKFNNSVMCN